MVIAAAMARRADGGGGPSASRNRARSVGSTAPQIAKPSGTPLCFSEKVTFARRGGETRARMCELAMVRGPEPSPTMKAESAAIATPPVAKTKSPAPQW